MAGVKHILVIRLSAMGDAAMTVPVLRALVLQHPEVKITVLSREFFSPFFEGIPNVSFYAADVKGDASARVASSCMWKILSASIESLSKAHAGLSEFILASGFTCTSLYCCKK